jgi:hypothetical protein
VPEEKKDGRSSYATGFCAFEDADSNAFANKCRDDTGKANNEQTRAANTIYNERVDGISEGADADPAALD